MKKRKWGYTRKWGENKGYSRNPTISPTVYEKIAAFWAPVPFSVVSTGAPSVSCSPHWLTAAGAPWGGVAHE